MFRAHVLIIRRFTLHSLWYHHAYRCDDTRGCVMQFWPSDDEHMCSKHVEPWNKLVKQKVCASSWLIIEINAVISFIERFFKEKAWWWLVISCKLSLNRFIFGSFYDCVLIYIYIYIYIYIHMTNSTMGINHFKITEQLLLTISMFLDKNRETCHSRTLTLLSNAFKFLIH